MSIAIKMTATQTVRESWQNKAPDWVLKLAAFCDSESQSAAARRMKRSASLVNMVLKNRYPGDLNDVKARVEAAFSKAEVQCPVLGNISGSECLSNQSKPYNSGNHAAVQLYVSCRRCINNVTCKEKNHAES